MSDLALDQVRKLHGRARSTNDPFFVSLHAVSRRTQARRRRDLVAIFLNGLGGQSAVSGVMLVAVKKAAELTLAAEMARADVLNGTARDLELLVKLEGEARRAVRALGFKIDTKPRGVDVPWSPLRAQLARAAVIGTDGGTAI